LRDQPIGERRGLISPAIRRQAKALEALRPRKEILSRITKLSPDNGQWKQDLAWFDRQIRRSGQRIPRDEWDRMGRGFRSFAS
jgi:hypothetical protein